jgi:hypothetical protein
MNKTESLAESGEANYHIRMNTKLKKLLEKMDNSSAFVRRVVARELASGRKKRKATRKQARTT